MIPQRVIMGIMGSLAIIVSWSLRGSLTLAITEMVVPLNNTGKNNVSIVCPVETPTSEQSSIVLKTVSFGNKFYEFHKILSFFDVYFFEIFASTN